VPVIQYSVCFALENKKWCNDQAEKVEWQKRRRPKEGMRIRIDSNKVFRILKPRYKAMNVVSK
jgi:hypothetical protein